MITKDLLWKDEVYTIAQFPIIEHRDTFLIKEFPTHYPGTSMYLDFWKEQKRRCIEGYWGEQYTGYRWIPGNLYFYANYGTIEHKIDLKNKSAPRVKIRPYLRDTEWEMSYNYVVARGFSGFEYDDEYTCNKIVIEYEKNGLPELNKVDTSVINSKGELKKFIEPYYYVRQVFKKPLGKALFYNSLENYMLMGSRGFGKSFYMGQAVLLHNFLFDGELEYVYKEEKTKVELFIGSGLSDKSSDFVAKFNTGLNNMPGAFKYINGSYHQHPFFKNTSGSIKKPPSVLYHKYKIKTNKGWKDHEGSSIKHGVFTTENPDAAAGGRLLIILVEEVGLLENLLNVHGSNEAAQDIDGKIGISIYIGTGGNIDKVVECSIMFYDPKSFAVQGFRNVYEEAGNDIGFFMSYHYARNDFKDENGNTDLQAVHEWIMKEREKRISNKQSSHNLDYYIMNYPIYPSEMFLSKKGGAFPINELRKRLNEVKTNGRYVKQGVPVKLAFDKDQGVTYEIDTALKPLDVFKPKNKYDNPEGCPVIYEFPIKIDGSVPNDMYIFGYDPYASDDQSAGESLGSFYVMKNYKYAMHNYGYSEIVASYIGKAYEGYNAFNENIEKLIMLYGSPPESLFFENDRGTHVVEYFRKRNKLWLLAPKPRYVLSKVDSIGSKGTVSYGYNIGGGRGTIKREAVGYLRDWLLEIRNKDENGLELRNLNLINDRALLEELLAFNYDDNFDRVMGVIGCIIGLRERTEYLKKEDFQERVDNPLEFLASNPAIFKQKPEPWRY
jgi:hypothetical protein